MARRRRQERYCRKCKEKVKVSGNICPKCGNSSLLPSWVVEHSSVSRQFSVEITMAPTDDGAQKRLTLYKWWPGDYDKIHIKTEEEWNKIAQIVSEEMCPKLGWKSELQIAEEIKKRAKSRKEARKELVELAQQHPKFLYDLIQSIKARGITEENYREIIDLLEILSEVLGHADDGFKLAFKNVIQKLPRQKKRALEDLSELLESWSLKQITSITREVMSRLATLDLFKDAVLDDQTYEIRGDNSIHRILEKAMWIVDERYWLLHSNATLRKIIGDEMAKKDQKKYGRKRPDFVCGTIGNTLILIELKRPSHTLQIEDLNKLETYLTIAEDNLSFRGYRAYLIGKRIDPELKRRLKHRGPNFTVMTFTDLIDSTEKRYREYLKILKKI